MDDKTKVYAVAYGEYSDYNIIALFSSKEKAYSKLSLERPLSDVEFKEYKKLCSKIGIVLGD